MKNNPKIDFHKSGAVYTVLKYYEFSETEKKIIQMSGVSLIGKVVGKVGIV